VLAGMVVLFLIGCPKVALIGGFILAILLFSSWIPGWSVPRYTQARHTRRTTMERLMIFNDYANIEAAFREFGIELDEQDLLSYLSEGRSLVLLFGRREAVAGYTP
jgi:hypothetical protein